MSSDEHTVKQRGGAACARGVLAASSLALAGCSNPLGPADSDYGTRVPTDRLREVRRLEKERYAAPPPAADETPAPPSDRFEDVETLPLTLEEARRATLEHNLDLRVALVDPAIAAQTLRAEEAKFEAVFRPSARYRESDSPPFSLAESNQQDAWDVGAGVDVPLRTGGRASVDLTQGWRDTDSGPDVPGTAYESALAFSLSQPLLRNAGRRATTYSIRIASYDQQIAEARTKLEVIRQLAAIDRSYWRLYAARRELEVRQTQHELANEQLERARRLVDAGGAPEVEVLRAEAGLAERLEAIIVAENAVRQQQREIKRVVNIPGLDIGGRTSIVPATEPDPVRYAFDGPELADHAVANRMEMLELELRLLQDYSTIEFQKNQALPLFALDYRYSIEGLGRTLRDSNDLLRENRFESWTLGVSGEVPLGNEAARSRVHAAILARLQRLSSADARRLSIRQEVFDAVDSIESAWQRILASRQNALAAARTFEAEQRQFAVGARTSTEVLEAAARVAEAQSSEIRAVADYQIAQVDLAFATGTLLGAAKVEWSPLDESEAPGADPTPPAFPFYADPERAERRIGERYRNQGRTW